MNHPNVLMLMGDQHPAKMTGFAGHPVVRTPAMDSIADSGAVFDAAYCPSPLCAPSRAALMSSRFPSEIEVWDNAAPFRSDWPTFAHSFRAAGYRTVLCGKMHFVGPDQLHGFEERWTQDIYPCTFDWTIPNRDGPFVKPLGKGQDRTRVENSGIGWTPDMDYDEEVAFRALLGLRRMRRESGDAPFFLCVSFTGPHYPFYAPKPYWDLYADSDIELPELREGYQAADHATVDWVRRTMHLEEPVDRDAALRATHATLGRITMLDDYVAKILAELENQGMAEDTIVLYTSDHGDMMGEHGLWFKCTHYDGSSRVPFAIRGPGIDTARRSEPISLLDLGPTLCGLTGVDPVGPASSGRDMSELVHGEREDEAGEAIVEYYGDGTRRGWRMIRSGDVKLTYAPEAGPLMFDLAEDPDERHDVADDPAYAAERERLLARVTDGWDPDDCDRRRYESEDRRIAIREAIGTGEPADWAYVSPPVPPPGTGHGSRKR